MSSFDLTRPDKLLLKGLQTLGNFGQSLYSDQKTTAKASAELTFIGEKKMDKVQSQLYKYNEEKCAVKKNTKDFNFLAEGEENQNYWLNFHGIHNVGIIKRVGEMVPLDRLTIRQILDTTQRPKLEEYDNYLFFSIKSIAKKEGANLEVEQLSFVLGSHYVISFQEELGDHFESIRDKLDEGLGFLRKKTNDYLLIQLLDAILDNYLESIDQINLEILEVEKVLFDNPDKATLIILESQKRSAQLIKKSLSPFKDALLNIIEGRNGLVKEENIKYYKDVANSATGAIDEMESTLKTLEGLTNIYFASLSQKMNETMKVLTTVATIFIPLTFIAGIYGMNFENMPELKTENGYFIVWGVMIALAILMIAYFKKKKWV